MSCDKAPRGWYCTRSPGHDGPCAALPEPATLANETTTPPASPEAKALRAIDQNLDVLGVIAGQQAAALAELAQLGTDDAVRLRRIDGNTQEILRVLREVSGRLDAVEQWQGDHAREHARQQ